MKELTKYEKCVKKELRTYNDTLDMCVELRDRLKECDIKIKSISACRITDMPHGGERKTLDELYADKDELERRLDNFLIKSKDERIKVQNLIDTVISAKHNKMLTLHYIDRMEISQIASQEHYSSRHAYRIFKEALSMVKLGKELIYGMER